MESVEVEAEIVTKVLEEVKYDKMLKKDLLAECVKKGLEVDGKSTKAVIIAALRASTNENHKELEMPVENTVEDENVENTTTGRGRKGRVAVALQEEQQKVATPVKKGRVPVVLEEEKEARIVTPVKTTRGKKVMKEAVVDQEQAVTVEKPKRGRGKKVEEKEHVETVEDKEESTSKPEESSSQRRRGRKTKESSSPSQIPTEAPSLVEDPASPALKAAAKPKRGAKKGKAKVRSVLTYFTSSPKMDKVFDVKFSRWSEWQQQIFQNQVQTHAAPARRQRGALHGIVRCAEIVQLVSVNGQ